MTSNAVAGPQVNGTSGGQPAAIPHRLRSRMAALHLDVSTTLHRTDKSSVFNGRHNGRRVVVKLLTTDDLYWSAKHVAEQDLYRRLKVTPPPVRIPTLMHGEPGLTVLAEVPGVRLGQVRYPHQVDLAAAEGVLATLNQLHAWTPPEHVLGGPQPITGAYIDRQAATGQLTTSDLTAIAHLRGVMTRMGTPLRPEHGDAWATNLLIGNDATVSLVDLEHLGWHVPGVDWALLYLLLGPGTNAVRPLVLQQVERQQMHIPFALNLMLLACREWGMHQSWGGQVWESTRPALRGNLELARDYLHHTAAAHGMPTTYTQTRRTAP